jgi:hypothetical protein
LYFRLRMSAAADIGALYVVNPAIIAAIPRLLAARAEMLIRDLRDGTLDGRTVATPDRATAARLDTARKGGRDLGPRDVWPALRVISCWMSGSAKHAFRSVRHDFGDAVFSGCVIGASEGITAMQFSSDPHETIPLAFGVYLEFLPLGESERTMGMGELQPGAVYEIVITQSAGLYRYRLGDLVRVVRLLPDRTPVLRYLGRSASCEIGGVTLFEHDILAWPRSRVPNAS